MNYMKQVAQMLGVELEEEFNIEGIDYKYKFTKDGLFFHYEENNINIWYKLCDDLSDILTGEYKIIKKPKPILDEAEKRYLSNVIKPFRERVESIYKGNIYLEDSAEEYIGICIQDQETILPHFEKGTMYKGMELDKEYSLKDLGL